MTDMPNAVERIRTTWRNIAWKKLDVQTTNKIIQYKQDLAMFTKKKRKDLRWNMGNVSFLEARKIIGTYKGENSYASFAQRADTTNEDIKYRTLVDKLIQLKANDWPKFQEHLKKTTLTNFTKHQLNNGVGNGRDPML